MCSLDPRRRYVLTGRGWRQIVRRHQDGTFLILKFPVKLGCLDGAVVQLFVRRRSSVLCARAKPRERMQQQGQKSLRPRRAIAKMAVSASSVYRCWLEKAKRRDPEPIRLDLRAAKALRFQRLQTLALPLPVIDLLPGLDSGCCRWRGS